MTEGKAEQGQSVGGVRAAWLAWSVCAVSLFVLAASLLLIVLGWSAPLPLGLAPWHNQAITLVGIIGAPVLGGLIASRRPRNPYGWIWLGFGLGLSLQQLGTSYEAYAQVVGPGSLLAPGTASHLLGLGGPLALGFAPFLLLLFPTGRLPSRRWRLLAWIAALSGVVLVFMNLLVEKPDKVGGTITVTVITVVALIFLTIILSALSLVIRYHRASGVERQQLKWFALAAVVSASFIFGEFLSLNRVLGGTVWHLFDVATNLGLYLAVGVAILRYRLYDIDIIINRTLVYGSLTAMLVLFYFGGVISLQYVFRVLTGGESQLAVVASTLIIAALFNPLRHRIQSFIDRRFYRQRYDAARTLAEFASKLREETDLDALNTELMAVVRETMQPAHLSLWLRLGPPEKDERVL